MIFHITFCVHFAILLPLLMILHSFICFRLFHPHTHIFYTSQFYEFSTFFIFWNCLLSSIVYNDLYHCYYCHIHIYDIQILMCTRVCVCVCVFLLKLLHSDEYECSMFHFKELKSIERVEINKIGACLSVMESACVCL